MGLVGSASVAHDNSAHEFGCIPETGFDCSGVVLHVLRLANISVPNGIRHCSEFFDHFGVLVHYELQQAGDLVFFTHRGYAPRHMGVMVNKLEYVHSPGINGEKVEIAKLKRELIPINDNKQLYAENPIGFKRAVRKSGRWNVIA